MRGRRCTFVLVVIVLVTGVECYAAKHSPADNAAADNAAAADDRGQIANRPQDLLKRSRRIVFLGDSITYAGRYVACFEVWLLTQKLDPQPFVIDVGLPSETVSGLSEEGHAGGRFPRPDLAERLQRVLVGTKPDLVIACYGINCGIYQPFDTGRFQRYQQGIRRLRRLVADVDATLVLMTPPFYDDRRKPGPFSYNAVLDRYAKWLVAQREQGWLVVDVHGAMTREVTRRRRDNPDFTFQPDAVHPNAEGHWFLARQLIRWFGDEKAGLAESPRQMLTAAGVSSRAIPLIEQRMQLLRDAYLSDTRHGRPGIRAGLPLAKAQKRAQALSDQIHEISAELDPSELP